MISLEKDVVDRVVAALPLPIKRMLRMSGLFLAGGFIRSIVEGEVPKDVDIWVPSREEGVHWARLLGGALRRGSFATPNAITISFPDTAIQFITRWTFSDPVTLISSFDFTIAQAVVWFDKVEGKWRGMCAETFLEDVGGKRLVYKSPVREEDAAGSLLRVNKFVARGYTISDEDMGRVAARVVKGVVKERDEAFSFSVGLQREFDVERATVKMVRGARPQGGSSV